MPGHEIPRDSIGLPYTSRSSEVTDIGQLARSMYEAPADFVEPYMPSALINAAELIDSGNRYPEGPRMRPYLEVLGGESLAGNLGLAPLSPGAQPRTRVILPGYNHIDVITAAARQNNGQPEGASAALVQFALQVTPHPSR